MFSSLFGVGDLDSGAFAKLVVTMGKECGRFLAPTVDPEGRYIVDGGETLSLRSAHATFLSLPRRDRLDYIRTVVLAPKSEQPLPLWGAAEPDSDLRNSYMPTL